MSAELISQIAQGDAPGRQLIRPVTGVLVDGTPYYAPIGEILVAGARVTCHLCGRSFRSVTAHARMRPRPQPDDGWLPPVTELGFPDVTA